MAKLGTNPNQPNRLRPRSGNARINHRSVNHRVQKPIENDAMRPEETGAVFIAALKDSLPFAGKGASVYATVRPDRRADYHFRHEPILYGWLENGAHYFTEDRTQDSVFEVDKPHVSDLHPTTKPVELIARMITK